MWYGYYVYCHTHVSWIDNTCWINVFIILVNRDWALIFFVNREWALIFFVNREQYPLFMTLYNMPRLQKISMHHRNQSFFWNTCRTSSMTLLVTLKTHTIPIWAPFSTVMLTYFPCMGLIWQDIWTQFNTRSTRTARWQHSNLMCHSPDGSI